MKQKGILFLSLLLSLLSHLAAQDTKYICANKWPKAEPPYHFKPNKCGPDSPLADILPNNFGSVSLGEACNKHDRCWMELYKLNHYGRCEVRFTKDLMEACAKAEICTDFGFGKKCVTNPMEIAACQSLVVSTYSAAAISGAFLLQLEDSLNEQKEFEQCVKKYGYTRRPKESSNP